MESIIDVYKLEEDKKTKKYYGSPDVYLGTNIHKFWNTDADEDDPHCWFLSGDHYVNNIIANDEERFHKYVRKLTINQQSTFTQGYFPEMGTS